MKFTSKLIVSPPDNAGILVPAEVVEALAGGKHPRVSVTLNGFNYRYRSSIAKMGDEYLIPASKARRTEGKLEVDVPYDIEIALDTAPREVEVPEELGVHFAENPTIKAVWDAMSCSNQLRLVTPALDAKKPETRARNIEKIIAQLSES